MGKIIEHVFTLDNALYYGPNLVLAILYIKATVVVSVCMGSAWKILPVTSRSPEITHLNTLNRAFLTISVFGHLEFTCTGGFHQNLFEGHDFQDVRFQFWDVHSVGFQDPNLEIFWT